MEELATLIENLLGAENDEQRAAALAGVDLGATETELQAAGAGLLAAGNDDDETIQTLEAIRDALAIVRGAMATAAAAETERTERRASLAAEIGGDAEGEPTEGDGETVTEGDEEGTETLAVEEPAPAPAPRPSLDTLRSLTPVEAQPVVEDDKTPVVKITAQIDVPNFTVGTSFREIRQVAEAMIARRQALGNVTGTGISHERAPIVHFDYLDELPLASMDAMENGLMFKGFGNGGGNGDSLTASGGYGAPAQVIYNFVKVNQPTDLVQDFLPVMGAPRGSVQYPTSPDIRDAFSGNLARAWSNTDDINATPSGTHKITAVIAAPAFNTCTVGVEYVILQFGNLGTRAYPEWVEHWIGLSMDAHAHKVSQKLMIQMVTASSAAVAVGPNAGAASTIFSNISLAAADMRHDLRMGKDAPLEMVVPAWLPSLVRSDLARARKGALGDTMAVSDEAINAWFNVRNVRPHYVEDWQDVDGSAATGASVWPSGMQFLLYPPGTFIKLDMGTLDLGIVRDSTLNATNDYNIFVESFESACKIGIESRLYSASICANGGFSADQNLSCSGVDIPGS